MRNDERDRVRGALLGLAVGDALGAPVEFCRRGSFPLVTEMGAVPAARLPAGAWTDDTAMALCLAQSLLLRPDFDGHDLLTRFCRWRDFGDNTSTGRCIGIGQNTLRALSRFSRTGAVTADATRRADGNGALMRVAPVACRHWRSTTKAVAIAASQSRTTHASELSAAACELAVDVMGASIAGHRWDDVWPRPVISAWPEEIARLGQGSWRSLTVDAVSSSGFVVHTLEAALWAVGTTTCFEDAVVRAVNLGDDADTVGAVAGQLAGARYGASAIPARWLSMLVKRELVEDCADALAAACDAVDAVYADADDVDRPTRP